ncbi:MAG: hypothetical protein PHY16_00125 [Methylobacter sp.]|nr:hypothetical protein [Methylobacter sp.]
MYRNRHFPLSRAGQSYAGMKRFVRIILKTAVELSKIPFALRQAQGERDFGQFNQWVRV